MVLIWNNVKFFQQHLEDMKAFRQAHDITKNSELTLCKNMPEPYDIITPCVTGGSRHVIKNAGKTIIVPIWKITLARDIQN